MQREKIKRIVPYTGFLIIGLALLKLYEGKMELYTLLQYELIIFFGYIAAVLDLKTKHIPNQLVLIMLGVWVIVMIPKLLMEIEPAIVLLKESFFGFLVGGGLFLIVYLLSRHGLGGGDVKFIAAVGLYIGIMRVLPAILYGTTLAALTGLLLILTKKINRKDSIPLVPFLYIGILIAIFYG